MKQPKTQIENKIRKWRKSHFPNQEEWWYAQNLLGDVLGWPDWFFKLSQELMPKTQKRAEEKWESDLKPFKHGEEGTHYACEERMVKYEEMTPCCGCSGHNCPPQEQEEYMTKKQILAEFKESWRLNVFHCLDCAEDFEKWLSSSFDKLEADLRKELLK